MAGRFEELAWSRTYQGTLTLRRRWDPPHGTDVYEVKLDDEYLMSSLFTAGEVELARRALAASDAAELDVVVGGLGLGYTAAAVLDDPRVRSLTVVDALSEVIDWHGRGLLPTSARIVEDPRTELVHDDFFTLADDGAVDATHWRARQFHAVLVDIDHTPRHLLDGDHARFYTVDALQTLARRLHPGGTFGLWSDDPPDDRFLAIARRAFPAVDSHVVRFPNRYTGGESANTVYVASTSSSVP